MKNMLRKSILFTGALLWFSVTIGFSQKKAKAINLFNGTDIKDWVVKITHHELGDNFGDTFRVEDGMIKVRYDKYDAFNNQYGHLYFEKPFSSFHLTCEYRFTGNWRTDAPSYTKLNSGIMFHSQAPQTLSKDQLFPISVELQFLGEQAENVPRPTGNMCSPGTDVFFNGKKDPRHCIESSSKTYKKDEWVKAELIVYGDSLVRHIINGEVVLEYTNLTMGGGMTNNSDPAVYQVGKPLNSGYIALQSEGQEIDFRNITIIDLSKK